MDTELFFDAEAQSKILRLAHADVGMFSARSPEKSSPNEDAAAVMAVNGEAAVLAVADGLGGLPAGQQASALAIRRLVDAVAEAPSDEPSLRAAILNGIEDANRAVCELGLGAATTLAVAEICGHSVRPYHVGDSMILVVGQRGRIKLQTVSHSPVGYAVEAGMLDEAEAMHHADRHLVSNILGAPDMRIEVGSAIDLARFDTVLLASDGLFDNLHTGEIVERIRKGPMQRIVDTLAADCRRRMQSPQIGVPSKPDDVTFVALRRRPDPS